MDAQDGKRVSLLLEIFSMSCKQASRDLSTGIRAYRWNDQPEYTEESNEHKDNVRHVDTEQTVNEDVEQTQISSMVYKPIIRINRAIGGGGGQRLCLWK